MEIESGSIMTSTGSVKNRESFVDIGDRSVGGAGAGAGTNNLQMRGAPIDPNYGVAGGGAYYAPSAVSSRSSSHSQPRGTAGSVTHRQSQQSMIQAMPEPTFPDDRRQSQQYPFPEPSIPGQNRYSQQSAAYPFPEPDLYGDKQAQNSDQPLSLWYPASVPTGGPLSSTIPSPNTRENEEVFLRRHPSLYSIVNMPSVYSIPSVGFGNGVNSNVMPAPHPSGRKSRSDETLTREHRMASYARRSTGLMLSQYGIGLGAAYPTPGETYSRNSVLTTGTGASSSLGRTPPASNLMSALNSQATRYYDGQDQALPSPVVSQKTSYSDGMGARSARASARSSMYLQQQPQSPQSPPPSRPFTPSLPTTQTTTEPLSEVIDELTRRLYEKKQEDPETALREGAFAEASTRGMERDVAGYDDDDANTVSIPIVTVSLPGDHQQHHPSTSSSGSKSNNNSENSNNDSDLSGAPGDSEEYRYMVLAPYLRQREDELTLEVGESVSIYKIYEDGFCLGKNASTGEEGVFPLNCVRGAPARTSAGAYSWEAAEGGSPTGLTPGGAGEWTGSVVSATSDTSVATALRLSRRTDSLSGMPGGLSFVR
ncbi:hypothetical protein HK102_011788 [Quaeritorhiza haematococci]|nr:hypothetical protein HK102_011788 [Quaeritorhiza haematococci]